MKAGDAAQHKGEADLNFLIIAKNGLSGFLLAESKGCGAQPSGRLTEHCSYDRRQIQKCL